MQNYTWYSVSTTISDLNHSAASFPTSVHLSISGVGRVLKLFTGEPTDFCYDTEGGACLIHWYYLHTREKISSRNMIFSSRKMVKYLLERWHFLPCVKLIGRTSERCLNGRLPHIIVVINVEKSEKLIRQQEHW